jgi:predicted nucleic acid-binding protein
LINFAEIGRMDLLQQLFGEIVIPTAVADELRLKSKRFSRAATVCDLPFVRVQSAKNQELVDTLHHEIHKGEAECIALALEQSSAVLILDDLAARMVAQQRGLPMIGTIGCLQVAKRDGLISQIAPLLRDVRNKARFWLSPRLIERVLEDAHEDSIE